MSGLGGGLHDGRKGPSFLLVDQSSNPKEVRP
jgi:hypothetical protein